MRELTLRTAESCRWDCISLGDVMLRFDPGPGRIDTARRFSVNEGGGEYNVARGLRRCFGLRTAITTCLADNSVGRLIEDLMLQGGVDLELLRWLSYDGVGRNESTSPSADSVSVPPPRHACVRAFDSRY